MTDYKPMLSDVSLVCVESRYPALALYAIERCRAAATFKECLLLSPVQYDVPDYIQQVKIGPVDSVEAYSHFMVHELGQHFSGSHVLVIQWDSFILNGGFWDPRFLDYDYVGAPWPHRPVAVGNGGFSLRSKRLCLALQRISIPQAHPEDQAICEWHGEQLQREHGIRFAPAMLATDFAFELVAPLRETFGFHGFFNFHHALGDRELDAYLVLCDDATLQGKAARGLVKNLVGSGRYAMARRLLQRRLTGSLGLAVDALLLGLRCGWHALSHRQPGQRPAPLVAAGALPPDYVSMQLDTHTLER